MDRVIIHVLQLNSFPWIVQCKNTVSSTLKCSAIHLHCSRRRLLASLGCVGEQEPGDSKANQKTHCGQHRSEPYWHVLRAIRGDRLDCAVRCGCCGAGWSGQAVHLCEDVRMFLENMRGSSIKSRPLSWTIHAVMHKLFREITTVACEKCLCGSCLTSVGHLMPFLSFVKWLYVFFSPTGSN